MQTRLTFQVHAELCLPLPPKCGARAVHHSVHYAVLSVCQHCRVTLNFPLYFLEKLIDLRNEYLQADEATKRFLEQRYGKRVIQKALEEMESKDWLEKNSKSCPCCGTPIQVTAVGQA